MVWTLTKNPNVVIRDADHAHVPNDPGNGDWRAYQAWLAVPNTPNPVPPPTKAQEAAAWMAGGLTVNFTSGAAPLSGRYGVVTPWNHQINTIATSQAYDSSALPGGLTTVKIATLDGKVNVFSKSDFKLLMRAIRDFVYDCNLYVLGEIPALPPNVTSKSIEELQEA